MEQHKIDYLEKTVSYFIDIIHFSYSVFYPFTLEKQTICNEPAQLITRVAKFIDI